MSEKMGADFPKQMDHEGPKDKVVEVVRLHFDCQRHHHGHQDRRCSCRVTSLTEKTRDEFYKSLSPAAARDLETVLPYKKEGYEDADVEKYVQDLDS